MPGLGAYGKNWQTITRPEKAWWEETRTGRLRRARRGRRGMARDDTIRHDPASPGYEAVRHYMAG